MNKYEMLLDRISREIPVIELPLKSLGFEGTYFNGAIYVDSSMATSQKIGVLTEEYAHFKTSVGTIIDYDDSESRKQDVAQYLKQAINNPANYLGSEWARLSDKACAACDVYRLTTLECEYYFKFAIHKNGSLVLVISCHLSR